MNKRMSIILVLLIPALCSVAGCASFLVGHNQGTAATEDVLAGLEPDQARTGQQVVGELAEYFENFGMTSPGIYRSAAPDVNQLQRLKDAGFVSVIDFRTDPAEVAAEAEASEQAGLKHFNLPWRGQDKELPREHIASFFGILSNAENLPVLVHCKRGAERTGLMIALYRIEFDGWTPERAYREMNRYRFRSTWFGHLKRHVLDYEKGSIEPQ